MRKSLLNTNMQPKTAVPLTLLVILLLAGLVRKNTFYLSHTSGDEFHYLALALKLDSCGLDGYNIRRIDYESFSLDGKTALTEIMLAPEGEDGSLLKDMKKRGRGYYDNPLYNNSPALPYLLMLSQKTIGKGNGYFVSSSSQKRNKYTIKPLKTESIFHGQLYAAIVPFFFSLLFVLLTFFLGKQLFGAVPGLIAAFLVAFDPVSMLTSQKLWGDEISGVFVLLSALAFIHAWRKNSFGWGLVSGVAVGIAVLFKQTAGFFMIGLVLFYIWQQRKQLTSLRTTLKFLTNPVMLAWGVAFILTTAFWFLKVYEVYGHFIHKHVPGEEVQDTFAQMKRSRPATFLVFLVGVPYLSPLMVFAWGALSKKLKLKVDENRRWQFTFLAFWIAAYFMALSFFFPGGEHRYFLPAHPAIAVLAAFVINEIRKKAIQKYQHWLWLTPNEMVIVGLILFSRWSYHLAIPAMNRAEVMLLQPF